MFYFTCVSLCLLVSVLCVQARSASRGQKWASDPLELELGWLWPTVCVLDNRTWVLCKTSKHSERLSRLSSPQISGKAELWDIRIRKKLSVKAISMYFPYSTVPYTQKYLGVPKLHQMVLNEGCIWELLSATSRAWWQKLKQHLRYISRKQRML